MLETLIVLLIAIVVVWVIAYLAVTYLVPRPWVPAGIATLLVWVLYAIAALMTIVLLLRAIGGPGALGL